MIFEILSFYPCFLLDFLIKPFIYSQTADFDNKHDNIISQTPSPNIIIFGHCYDVIFSVQFYFDFYFSFVLLLSHPPPLNHHCHQDHNHHQHLFINFYYSFFSLKNERIKTNCIILFLLHSSLTKL